jgi:hypothetical protein
VRRKKKKRQGGKQKRMQSKQSKVYNYFSPAKNVQDAKRQRNEEKDSAPEAKRTRLGIYFLTFFILFISSILLHIHSGKFKQNDTHFCSK